MEKNVPARQIIVVVLLVGVLLAVNGSFSSPVRADWHSLTGTLPAYVGSVNFDISPDSHYVVYKADVDRDDTTELYSVPISGTIPIKLNPPLIEDGDVDRFFMTPDSQFVIYIADQEVDNRKELYRVPISGGTAEKLNANLVTGGNIETFQIDPENQFVVYLADQESNDVRELWSVPIGGGTSVKLNGTFVAGGDISTFKFDPLSNRVVYSADQEVDGRYELYSVPIAGGNVIKLNPPIVLIGGGDSGILNFQINPIIPVVVFLARETNGTGYWQELYMVPTAGGIPAAKISVPLTAQQNIYNFGISPGGDRVVYTLVTRAAAGSGFPSKGILASTLIGGGNEVILTEPAAPTFGAETIRFTLDGSRVVYTFQGGDSQIPRLESSTVQSGVRATLYEPSPSDAPLYTYQPSSDPQWVIYQTGDFFGTAYTVPSAGGGSVNHGPGHTLFSTPDGSRLLFTRITGTENQSELISSQIFGGGVRDLSGMAGSGYVGNTVASADGSRIVFLVQIGGQYDLRVSDGTPPSRLPRLRRTPRHRHRF